MKGTLLVLVLVGVFAAGVGTFAHHSFSATYREDLTVTIEGELVQFLFRNPHSFVHVMAEDEAGKRQRWSVEWGGGAQLGRQGVSRGTLKPGDHVVITGNPGRDPNEHRIRLRTLHRPSDGFSWGTLQGEVID